MTTTVAPAYIPGFTHLYRECIIGFFALTALFFLLQIPGSKISPAEKFCTEESKTYPPPCTRPSLLAFEGVCGTVFVIMAILSVKAWHIDRHPQKDLAQTPVGRVYGYSPLSEKIAALSFVFQGWSCIATPFIPEFYSGIMMAHHIMATTVSYLALQNQYYHYYVIFFLALTEVSSVPLVIISLSKYYPQIFSSYVPAAQPMFAVLFPYYRVYMWFRVGAELWSDAFAVLKKDKGLGNGKSIAEQYRPGKNYAIYVILTIHILLAFLQLFWFAKIVDAILKMFGIDLLGFE